MFQDGTIKGVEVVKLLLHFPKIREFGLSTPVWKITESYCEGTLKKLLTNYEGTCIIVL